MLQQLRTSLSQERPLSQSPPKTRAEASALTTKIVENLTMSMQHACRSPPA